LQTGSAGPLYHPTVKRISFRTRPGKPGWTPRPISPTSNCRSITRFPAPTWLIFGLVFLSRRDCQFGASSEVTPAPKESDAMNTCPVLVPETRRSPHEQVPWANSARIGGDRRRQSGRHHRFRWCPSLLPQARWPQETHPPGFSVIVSCSTTSKCCSERPPESEDMQTPDNARHDCCGWAFVIFCESRERLHSFATGQHRIDRVNYAVVALDIRGS